MSTVNNHQLITRIEDAELSGNVNQATGQGKKFALLMAMMANDILQRPSLQKDDKNEAKQSSNIDVKSYYPPTPLKADLQSWPGINNTSRLLKESAKDALLWQVMHPDPLSLRNDVKFIEDEIKQNCDFDTQLRLADSSPTVIEQDATGLYDILQGMDIQPSRVS